KLFNLSFMGLKIAQIVCTYPPYKGGMGTSVYNFAKYLARTGHEITIFTPYYKRGEKVSFEEQSDSNVIIKRIKPFFVFGNSAILFKLLGQLKTYDIIHLHYPFFGTAELIAFKKLLAGKKMKLIVHYHMDNKAKGLKGFIFEIARIITMPFVMAMADEITCASIDYVKHSNIGKYWNKHKGKFTQVSFGVDTKTFKKSCEKDDSQAKNILFVGGLDAQHYFKGVENLIRAFKKISTNPNYNLWIVGKGNLEEHYKEVAKDLSIYDRVKFINNADTDEKLVAIYSKADVLALPSINCSEAFGLVLLEAMACGTPVVASNLPGVRSVFSNNKQGLLVQPDNINDLAEKILMIINEPEKATRYSQEARAWVQGKYTWEKVAERLNAVYYRVMYSPTKK
ncbi:MAG: glycosyltransferase family 4 protein, partial [bacterium]